jgi:hypothetical protein
VGDKLQDKAGDIVRDKAGDRVQKAVVGKSERESERESGRRSARQMGDRDKGCGRQTRWATQWETRLQGHKTLRTHWEGGKNQGTTPASTD